MNWQKLNKTWIGLLSGLIAPWTLWGIYWLIFQRDVDIPKDDVHYFINNELMVNVFKICCGIDLVFFYVGMNKKMINYSKGIIFSVMVYAFILGYLTFF
jgi:hypothetical protein